jgi:predicted nucleic acid-binding Zn ribbon protein
VRRRAPRSLATAVQALAGELAPQTTLARVQAVWAEVAGEVVAAEARPEAERDGTVTFACSSAVWASELDLLRADLVERLNGALGDPPDAPTVRELRFRATGAARVSSRRGGRFRKVL